MKNFNFRTIVVCSLLLLGVLGAHAQGRTLSGIVSDSGGPIAGVTVIVKGTNRGTTTNMKGAYTISAEKGSTLLFSFLGYAPYEVKIGEQEKIDAKLTMDSHQVEELVVVGYGVQRKSDVTGAVASVKASDLIATPASNVGDMLRGRVAGVDITSSSGRPGSAPNIVIRGVRSVSASNTPLYIVDGSPVDGTEFSSINGADVSSIEVLKDAAAQAIYGARAANGVIMVTTKRGETGKTQVTLNSYVSRQSLWRNFDYYNGEDFYQLRREAIAGDRYYLSDEQYSDLNPASVFADTEMENIYNNKEFVDWEKLMIKPAIAQNYDLSIRGGTEKIKVAAGLGYYNQDGMVRNGSGYQRATVRMNVDYKAYNWLTFGLNTSFANSQSDREEGNFTEFITRSPLSTVYNPDGTYAQYLNTVKDINPLFRAEHYQRAITSDQYRVNAFLDIKPFKGFSYRFNASYFNRFSEDGAYKDKYYPGGGASGSLSNSKKQTYLIENIINYQVPFKNQDHSLNFTLVQSYDKEENKGMSYSADNVPVDFDWNMLPNGEMTDFGRSFDDGLLLSFMGRVQYSLKDKYLITAAIRRDGSSRFGASNKWGNFPSASAAWRISEESFIKDINQISNLKLRVSWGMVGNQNGISSYTSLGLANSYEMLFGDNYIVGYLPGGQLPNPNLKWEATASTNIGLDFGLFDNRLSGTIDYYQTVTTDMLIKRSISDALGYTSVLDNLGKTRTKGVDISINGDVIRTQKLRWSMGTNFSLYRNKIIDINGERDADGKLVNDVNNKWFVGSPLNVYYQYLPDGLYGTEDLYNLGNNQFAPKETVDTDGDGYADQAVTPLGEVYPGAVRIKDMNGDGKITPDDRQIINKEPKFTMSFSTTLAWKGIDVYADFYGVYGRKIQNSYLYDYNNGGALNGKLNGIKVDYWTPNNQDAKHPRPRHNNGISNHAIMAIEDASYFRLRTLTVGYTLPSQWTDKIKIEKVRLYITGTNLYTATKFLSYSPELTPGAYPEARQWVFGLNLNF